MVLCLVYILVCFPKVGILVYIVGAFPAAPAVFPFVGKGVRRARSKVGILVYSELRSFNVYIRKHSKSSETLAVPHEKLVYWYIH